MFATTHLSMVKAFVHDHPFMDNASVWFNRETLEPEYVLQIGVSSLVENITTGVPEAQSQITDVALPDPPVSIIPTSWSVVFE